MNKAEKSQIIVLIACFACVFLSAALIWNYYKKPADENEALIVTIKYPEYENAVITPVSTMECAIDNEFLHELQQILHFTELSGRHSVLERPLSEVNGRLFFS